MRLTTKLSAFISLLSLLTMTLMVVGSALSFLWFTNQHLGQRVEAVAAQVDRAWQQQSPAEMAVWLRQTMGPLQIERIELFEQGQRRLSIQQHQDALLAHEKNHFNDTRLPLPSHPGGELRMLWLDPADTLFSSQLGLSLLAALAVVLALMVLILLLSHRWLRQQLTGMERLEARAEALLKGQRSGIARGDVHEWPPKASSAIDVLLGELRDAQEQHTRLDTLIRSFAAQDVSTGLNNRLFFDNQLTTLLEDSENVGTRGVVMMIRLPDFDTLTDTWGDAAVREYQFALVNMFSTFVMRYPAALLARYFHSDFTVLLPHRSLKDAGSIATQLINAVDSLPPTPMVDRQDMIHIGISAFRSGQTTQQVMESVELATRDAALTGGNTWSVGSGLPEEGRVMGSVKWRTLLENTLQRGGPRLYQKPAVTDSGQVHHREMMTRIWDGDQELLAAEYMPLVQQMGLAESFDRQLVTRILALAALWPQETLAMPITIDSLLQHSFMRWLRDALLHHTQAQRQRILIELAEAEVSQHLSRLQPVLRFLRGFGCRIAVNQAGLAVVSTAYVRHASIEIIKLHPGLVRNIDKRTENQLFVKSLVEACSLTPTRVFAAGVKSRAEWQTLAELGVAGGQGDYFSPSEPVSSSVKKYSRRYRV
ncbi:RNase E specificity factor CsrD [Pantoea sp. 1.19]|uniref:RNase E specificity factor CsrD n=1 Tax=Pantoea sp. 1.19 TaxID=1925589 RepID=UPI000948C2EF|nr:RNase E specificity factor CsrD [Pantoea sp. 1.19]